MFSNFKLRSFSVVHLNIISHQKLRKIHFETLLADILDQAYRDPEQIVDPSISTLQVTLDLICLVPPREPDYSRLKSRSRYRTRSSSVSSLSSDSPHEKMVKFENIDGAQQSVSVTASHDRESRSVKQRLTENILKIGRNYSLHVSGPFTFSLNIL